mmetsp:Transcript_2074/g.2947  ORF Transcript_2074/g.2947 Transcript_2074/m.2947 type:complete len:316 (+) Transcript_2074:4202-5149(+)|eukprot:CAMPEP_0178930272 /NCGR_PEP_ID=MMETSP0786-20121207/21129_1 /TAXON_ID=186022 /ORGANISM="Thalassionema frauenfeldii, Strain CCMP 1798" /LENGTH=315 /DNA_ID=CAMNT_0020606753 /DNA_START=1159 /DNA_END=2106 /DNA_ORIENTATION=-
MLALTTFTFLLNFLLANSSPASSALLAFPTLKYGTAWKKERTADLVYQAVRAGFRHVDTACQPRHYNEAGVGDGWTKAAQELGLSRDDIWLQTKFTSLNGQDPNRIPYDKKAPLDERVRQSLEKSFENLKTDYIDSLVMHGMEQTWEDTLTVWRVFESFIDDGKVRQIGISNFYEPDAVQYLYENARIKPAVVQNRFYQDTKYDTEIRSFCREHEMEYQSFWTLGANRHFLNNAEVAEYAREKQLTPETLLYAFVMAIGITPLDGTTNPGHMAEDMALLRRVKGEETIFSSEDLIKFAGILGIPNFALDEEEEEL